MPREVKCRKTYVDVVAKFDALGNICPIEILWRDGQRYEITRISDVRRAASLKAGGVGIRYTCQIGRSQSYLFLEDNKWFVEEKCI